MDELKKEVAEATKQEVVNYSDKDFQAEYEQLCKKMGHSIFAKPIWVQTNHGSFELVLEYLIGKINPPQA